MSALIFGLLIIVSGTLVLFVYNEGERSLKLSRQIKQSDKRYRQLP
jgi:hypothetical protein